VTFFGGNGEFWLVREQPFDVSLIAGLHGRTGSKTANFAAVDLTVLASGHATPRLELFGAVDLAFEGLGEPGRTWCPASSTRSTTQWTSWPSSASP
jgi:hypothetical protein